MLFVISSKITQFSVLWNRFCCILVFLKLNYLEKIISSTLIIVVLFYSLLQEHIESFSPIQNLNSVDGEIIGDNSICQTYIKVQRRCCSLPNRVLWNNRDNKELKTIHLWECFQIDAPQKISRRTLSCSINMQLFWTI